MILGIDVGGTNIDVVVYDEDFEHVATYPTEKNVSNLNSVIEELVERFEVEAVGVGLAAWIKRGKIVKMPNIRGEFRIDLEIPHVIDNDANCFAFYSAKLFEVENLLGVTIGTGIGSGIVADGRLIHGEGLAGEIGHWFVGNDRKCTCGGVGHLEANFGGWSLKEQFGRDAKEMIEDGSIYLTEGFRMMCVAVANAVTLLDPEAVVFGGRIGGNLDVEKLKECIYRYLMPEFRPEILTLRDPLAVAKGACLLAEESVCSKR